jgi:anti-anti-sigma factor
VAVNEQRRIDAGLLKLQVEQYGETRVIQLSGELDLANVAALERELRAGLDDGASRLVVDMGGLEFIDSTGIALLVSATGEDGAEGRIRLLRSRALGVIRVLELTGVAERLPFADGSPDGDGSAHA